MNENLKAIIKAASEDEELRAEVSALMGELNVADEETRPEVIARIIALANDKGFDLAEDDLVVEAPGEGEVVDEELAIVSGGCCGSPAWCPSDISHNGNCGEPWSKD